MGESKWRSKPRQGCWALLPLLALLASPGLPVAAAEVCVIAPRVEPDGEGRIRGQVPTAKPTLVVLEPIEELWIERVGRPHWRKTWPAKGPYGRRVKWPVSPLKPLERATLRIRPLGALPGDFATVIIQGATAPLLKATARRIKALKPDPVAWMREVDGALDRSDVPLAWALLFAPEAPGGGELAGLRTRLEKMGCGGAGSEIY